MSGSTMACPKLASLVLAAVIISAACGSEVAAPDQLGPTKAPRPEISEQAAISAVAGALCPAFPALVDPALEVKVDGTDWVVTYSGHSVFSVDGETARVLAENDRARTALSIFGRQERCAR